MPRRLALIVAITLWILVAWYWVAWPSFGYLQARDALGGVTSWDMWRPLIAGPLDEGTLPSDPSGYQYVLLYGNWLFGYLLLGSALSTAGRLFTERRLNLIHGWSYLVLVLAVGAFLIFGSGRSTAGSAVDEGIEEGSEIAGVEIDDDASTTTAVEWQWSYGFKAMKDQLLTKVKTGADYLLPNRGDYELYTTWAEWGGLAVPSFEAAKDDILSLLILLDDESRPKSVKDSFAYEAGLLRNSLEDSISHAAELNACARTSQKNGDCDEVLDDLLRSVEEANTRARLP